MNEESLRIAVVGSGAAGLTATHLLQRGHRVVLLEKNDRLGGHTNTVHLPDGPNAGVPVDTGFIVMNHRNYPLLTKLLEQLDVPLRDSDMSFSYHDLASGLQYSGNGFNGLFAQRMNCFKPSFIRMIRDVLRFFKQAEQDVTQGNPSHETLGEYLGRNGFGKAFVDHHLIPMGSAIWSTPCERMMDFPAMNFLRFFHNHGLLSLNDRPQWRTVVGGSGTYIDRMQQTWNNVDIRLNAALKGIQRDDRQVRLVFKDGREESFDQVILATHADQAFKLLLDPSDEEREALGSWQYARSRTLLHTDESVMPPIRRTWSSWNFCRIKGAQTCLTYHMNRLQGLNTEQNYFVSLDLPDTPRGVIREIIYEHPMFSPDALTHRATLENLNGTNRTWYAGSYMGNGFHEDAVRSAVQIAEKLGQPL